MRTLIAPTEDFIKTERTYLAANASAGTNVSLTLQNNNGIAQYTYIVIGYEGSELAEIQQVNTAVTPGQAVQVATLKFAHGKDEPVTVYRFNKRKFYGSVTEGGSYTELTADGSPADIQVDDPIGTSLEYTGVQGYEYFKSTYYNSQTTTETDIDDSDAVQGDQTGRYTSIYAIRKHAGLQNNPFYSDGRIEVKRKQAENEINSMIFSKYTLPLAEVPAMISYICELLAAGYIDYEEFGADGEGVKWLGTARALLKAIQEDRQRLIGVDGDELATKTISSSVQSYPDTTDNTNGPIRMFTTRQTF
jgi:phage gp36-like protein